MTTKRPNGHNKRLFLQIDVSERWYHYATNGDQLELELIYDDAGISPDNMKTVDRHHFTHPNT